MNQLTQKTCFVITGYGIKVDHGTGRKIDLDKTYEYIIEPVFQELGFFCFRACDIKHSGVIDLPMYENILKADFVLADISTLNANVLYELGIRHAVRKNTTIIISEEMLPYPFDLSHMLIHRYQHLGGGIDHGEVMRFKQLLKDKVKELMDTDKVDSPLYTLMPDLEVPRFSQKEIQAIKENIDEVGSLADYMLLAEEEGKKMNYKAAINFLQKARALHQDNVLVVQRLALMIYKSELPDEVASLFEALRLLQELNPATTTDVETLGLCGAIHKRLYERLGEVKYLSQAMNYYERGFYINSDYYLGINVAFLSNIYATIATNQFEAWGYYGSARRIRDKVLTVCGEIMVPPMAWHSRSDQAWVLLTMAEVYFSRGDEVNEAKMISEAEAYLQGRFVMDAYNAQKALLGKYLASFAAKYALMTVG